MKDWIKFLPVLCLMVPGGASARAVVSRAARITNTPTSGYTYNYMYPYMNNQMRRVLNPGDANAQSTSPINAVVRTTPLPAQNTNVAGSNNTSRPVQQRRVTARSGRVMTGGAANSGTVGTVTRSTPVETQPYSTFRRVSPRTSGGRTTQTTGTSGVANSISVSSSRCLSDYSECMNDYCVRSDTPYNRCFCSSRLSQIESTYQPQIDTLIKQILRAQDTGKWSDAEMAEYWNTKIGQYVGENTWEKLDGALNIEWPDASERMQGQGAYLTGHQYCVNNLVNCAYAAGNMRDVYRSEISRDCDAYEKSLERLKTALETALETYNN